MKYVPIVLLVLLSGCGTMFGPPDLTKIADNPTTKSAAASCAYWNGTGGQFKVVWINQEAGIIKDGGVVVTGDCQVSTNSVTPPRPAAPPTKQP